MKKLFFLVIILLPITITAGPATPTLTMTMDLPTTNDDSSTLTNLASVQIWCSTTQGGPYLPTLPIDTSVPPAPVIGDTATMTVSNCLTGYGTVYLIARATSALGMESINSNEAVRSFLDERVPDAPSNLRF